MCEISAFIIRDLGTGSGSTCRNRRRRSIHSKRWGCLQTGNSIPFGTDVIEDGFVIGHEREFGYFSVKELESLRGP